MEENVKITWKLKVAGIILVIIGAGIPLLAFIVTFVVYGIFYPPEQYLFTTGPVMILAVWLLPLIGGIYALRRMKWKLVLAGCISAISYIGPCTYIAVNMIRYYDSLMLPMIVLFCLLVLITLLAIPATVFIALSKKEFNSKD